MRFYTYASIAMWSLLIAAEPVCGIDLTAQEVLRLYEQSLTPMKKRVAFKVETDTVYSGAWKGRAPREIKTGMVYRDGGSLGFEVLVEYLSDEGKRSTRRKLVLPEKESLAKAYTYPKEKGGKGSVAIHSDIDFIRRLNPIDIGRSSVFDGYLPRCNNLAIPDVLREATSLRLRDATENIDGHDTYVLEAVTKYGKHTLWIDPKAGFNPRRILLEKAEGDYRDDRMLGIVPPPLPEDGISAVPRIALVKVELRYESIAIEEISGVFVPVSAKLSGRQQYVDGQFTEFTTDIRRSAIDFDPDFEALGAFVLDVPDGTPVSYYDFRGQMGVKYEWFKGKPRARVDQEFLDVMDASIETFQQQEKGIAISSNDIEPSDVNVVAMEDSADSVIAGTRRTGLTITIVCIVLALVLLGRFVRRKYRA